MNGTPQTMGTRSRGAVFGFDGDADLPQEVRRQHAAGLEHDGVVIERRVAPRCASSPTWERW